MIRMTNTAKAVNKGLMLSSLCGIAFVAAPLMANDATIEENVERIEVTGSRIQRTDMETSSPVSVIDRAEIDASGMATVSDFVRNLSSNSFGSFRDASGFGGGQTSQSTVSLRGLGADRTLILIDGRRMGSSVAFGGSTQNLNLVPMAAVERIEVLRDGASAVYGSDAVAGVINIITKKEYDGAEVDLEQSVSEHGGADTTNVRMTFGSVGEKTNIVASVEYFNREALYDSERDFSETLYSAYGWPGTGFYSDKNKPILGEDGQPILGEDGQPVGYDTIYFADNRCSTAGGNSLLNDDVCYYNAAADSATMAAQERFSTFVKVDHQLTDDVVWTNRLMVSRVWTEGQYAGTPNSSNPVLRLTEDNADIYEATVKEYGNDYLNSQLVYNDNNQLIDGDEIGLLMRTTPLGARVTNVEDTDINFLTAFEGYNDWFGGSTWNVGAQWIRSEVVSVSGGTANAATIQDLLDSGELDYFAASSDYVDGQNEKVIQKAAHTAFFNGRMQTYGVDGSISFDTFELANGAVPLALGFEWNRTEFDQQGDAATNQGNVIGSAGGDTIQGKSREVFSVSAESIVPLLDNLDLEISARYDDYSDFGDTINPKVGFSYRPVDSFLLRASWGTGFRAPSFDSLYGSQSQTFLWAIDRVGCDQGVSDCDAAQYNGYYLGNEELEAEESESLSVGIVWNITDVLDLELSYYDIEIDNVITTMVTQDIFDREADGEDVSDFLERDPKTGKPLAIYLEQLNLGKLQTSGIDFNLGYLIGLNNFGEMRLGLEGNYVLESKSANSPTAPLVDAAGDVGAPEYRFNLSSIWTYDDWSSALYARYTASQEDSSLGETPDQWILDAQVSHNFAWNGQLDLGIRNLLDEEPAMNLSQGFPGYDMYLYDPIGREFYVRYNHKF